MMSPRSRRERYRNLSHRRVPLAVMNAALEPAKLHRCAVLLTFQRINVLVTNLGPGLLLLLLGVERRFFCFRLP